MLKTTLSRRNMLSYRNLYLYKEKNIGNGKMKVNIQFIFLMLITLKDNWLKKK